MRPQRKRRLIIALVIVGGVGLAAALATTAFRQNLLFFFTPTQIAQGEAPIGKPFRIGGMVVRGSVQRDPKTLRMRFEVTDLRRSIPVDYTGIAPDLFAEGQGVVAKGVLDAQGVFVASELLAKHDENYMPPEVKDALAANGNPGQTSIKGTR